MPADMQYVVACRHSSTTFLACLQVQPALIALCLVNQRVTAADDVGDLTMNPRVQSVFFNQTDLAERCLAVRLPHTHAQLVVCQEPVPS